MALQWEELRVSKTGGIIRVENILFRAKVPGGWLLRALGGSGLFYADPEHAWAKAGVPKWEKVEGNAPEGHKFLFTMWYLFRTAVPGGWLITSPPGVPLGAPTVIFHPDPNHEWDGSSLP